MFDSDGLSRLHYSQQSRVFVTTKQHWPLQTRTPFSRAYVHAPAEISPNNLLPASLSNVSAITLQNKDELNRAKTPIHVKNMYARMGRSCTRVRLMPAQSKKSVSTYAERRVLQASSTAFGPSDAARLSLRPCAGTARHTEGKDQHGARERPVRPGYESGQRDFVHSGREQRVGNQRRLGMSDNQ